MWVKYNALPAAVDELVAMGLGSAGKTWMAIQVNDPGAGYGLTFKYYDTTFHYFKHVTFATLGISAGTWYHLAYVIDHANTIARILVNGVEIATDTPVGDALAALTLIDTNSSFYIGGSPSSGGSDVTMSDVAIYNTALSTAELLSHYQAAALPTCNSTSALVNGTWTHIGGAWDNATNKLYLDVGGANQCTYTHSGAYTINGGSNNLILGRRADGTNPWAGSVSDLRFYNVYSGTRSSTNRTATLNRY